MNTATQTPTIKELVEALNQALSAELDNAMSIYDEESIYEMRRQLWSFYQFANI